MGKFIINFTPTGLIPTKQMTPHVPVAVDEIVREVLNARKFGISIVYIYARDTEGKPTWEKEIYQEIIEKVRAVDGYNNDALILCVPACGPNGADIEEHSMCFDLEGTSKPDMGILPLGLKNSNEPAQTLNAEIIQKHAQRMKESGIKPILEISDTKTVNLAKILQEKGIIEPPFYFDTFLKNNSGNTQSEVTEATSLVSQLSANSYWSVGGNGTSQLTLNTMAILQGGGIRIGLGDNIYFDEEQQHLASNEDLLDRINEIAFLLDIAPYTPAEVREILNLEIE